MDSKKIPVRMCVACRKGAQKDTLIRLINKDGVIVRDITNKADGRGAYICASEACVKKAFKRNMSTRALKAPMSEELYVLLLKEVSESAK